MSSSQLPAPRKNPPVIAHQMRFGLILVMLTCFLGSLFWVGLEAFAAAHYLMAAVAFLGVLLSVWTFGSLYVTLPLSIRFVKSYYQQKDYAAIDRAHTGALKLLEKLPLRRRLDVAVTTSNLALARLCQGYTESSEALYMQAHAYLQKNPRLLQSLSAVIIYHNLAVVNAKLKKYVEAELFATKSLEISQLPKLQKSFKMVEAAPTAAIAYIRMKLNELESAEKLYTDALHIYDESPQPKLLSSEALDQGKAHCYIGQAIVMAKLDRDKESLKWCDKFDEMIAARPNAITTLAIEHLNELANLYMNKKIFGRAEKLLELAYKVGHDYPMHPDAKASLSYYEKLFLLTDRKDEVADMRARLRSNEQNPPGIEKKA